MWTLLWVLLTPGGDVMQNGVMNFETRAECNANRMKLEGQPMFFGQNLQAICIERVVK